MVKTEIEEFSYDDQDGLFSFDTTCSTCYAEFLDAEDLDLHVKQMHSSLMSSKYCQFCTEMYKDVLSYAEHVRDRHLLDLRCCRYCTKVFTDGGSLKTHEKKHLSIDSTYSCSQCNLMFQETFLLEMHERKTHDNDKDGCILQCMSFLSAILNLKAVPLLQTVGRKMLTCISCNYSSSNLATYNNHFKVYCKGYACDRCSTVFKSKKYLLKHMKYAKKCLTVEDYSDDISICKSCKKAVHPKTMQFHLKSCNALKCIDCDMVCKTIDELSDHQTTQHPLDMTLIRCKFCAKEFIGQTPLKKHIDRVHKPNFHLYKYKCVDCNDIFLHPQKLFAHYFSKHKTLEPFNCKICNKKFRVRKAFSLHIKLDHKSVGFVEFDDQYHVFFTANKSEKPFIPECVLPEEDIYESENDSSVQKKPKPFSIRTKELLETDEDATEAETEDETRPLKRKQPSKQIKSKRPKKYMRKEPFLIYSSDEEPLLMVRKRALKNRGNNKRQWSWKKNLVKKSKFTCTICNKKCYTYQNHQNHLSLHNKNQEIECVKCSKMFNSKIDLTEHMSNEHATSKLTETLKNILQKKKQDEPNGELTFIAPKKLDRHTITMKKVKIDKCGVSATIKLVDTDLSVRNFLENFTPDVNDTTKGQIIIDSSVSITPYHSPFYREPIIKLTKFKDEPIDKPVSLKMPQRFKQYDHYVKTKISIKLVQQPATYKDFVTPDYPDHNYSESFQDHDDDKNDIPEVDNEVSLEGTEEPPRAQHQTTRIIIPKMPKGYTKIHIATLQPEAPYFKIIKVDSDKLPIIEEAKSEEEVIPKSVIDLPGGTKLVTANPLAHLLGDKPLDQILEPVKNKNYKPVIKDFQGILAQAMQKLEEGPGPRKKKPKVNKSMNVE